ncbi:MAG: hypothetical protein BZ151_00985 [Desulfobacca sp. 4484_104]|nr:MAG: hypothetical protein BZ151_00985 [Desulfobacca sp. 4484_104]
MPIYDFICPHCGAKRDMLLLPGDLGEDILCPACGLGTLVRVVSAPASIPRTKGRAAGKTCCGRQEPCDQPPCHSHDSCKKN